MNTRALIMKLSESQDTLNDHSKLLMNEDTTNEDTTNEDTTNEDTTNEDVGFDCPVCGADLPDSPNSDGNYVCPGCGSVIAGDYLENLVAEASNSTNDEDEDEEDVDEARIRVRGGKVQKLTKKPKKGYKLANGRYMKMTTKELKARKKSAKKMARFSQTSSAKRKRAKSMKVRRRLVSSAQLESYLNDDLLRDTLNASIEEAYKSVSDEYAVPTVESVESCDYKDNKLVIESNVVYDDANESVAVTFEIDKFSNESGEYSVTESEGIFGADSNLTIGLDVTEGTVEPTSFDYVMNLGESTVIKGGVVLE